MTNKDLISKLRKLDQIKPSQNWVVLTKSQILDHKPDVKNSFTFQIPDYFFNIFSPKRLAYAFAAMLFIIIGTFGFAQYTVPGDLFFSVKKITEQSQAAISGRAGLKQDVAVLGTRINELAQVAKEGRTNNISSAINEVKQSASKVVESLKNGDIKDAQSAKELADEIQKIKQLKTLADIIDTPEIISLDNALMGLVQNEISDLEKATLTEEQKESLKSIKEFYENGDYATALEEILTINKSIK